MIRSLSRRDFLAAGTGVAGYFFLAPAFSAGRVLGANERLRFACIGVGGKGGSDTDQAGKLGDIVALCDIDDNTLGKQGREVPQGQEVPRLPQAARRDGQEDRRRDRQHARPHPRRRPP